MKLDIQKFGSRGASSTGKGFNQAEYNLYKKAVENPRGPAEVINNGATFRKLYEKYNERYKQEKERFKASKREGFGDYNANNVPVYKNKIDYTGDFSTAKLSTLTDSELNRALKVQKQQLSKAQSEPFGDQRTRNGKMQRIFKIAREQQYSKGVEVLQKEIDKRDKTKATKSYYSKKVRRTIK